MRPEARVAAATEILDEILKGSAAERSLTTWARSHRFAGSKDRAAIRDLVFDALRRMRSYAWLGGGMTGRSLMIGRLRNSGQPVHQVFSGEGYAPEPLTDAEVSAGRSFAEAPMAVRLDCPEWLWAKLSDDLGETAEQVLALLRERAPVFLRVNRARIDRVQAQSLLADEGIDTEPHPLAETALRVLGNETRLRQTKAFQSGLVELQDAASQAVVARCLAHLDGGRVLDYCAGGGGKSLALAAEGVGKVVAHDRDPGRMKDIPNRARRAGAEIEIAHAPEGTFDLVLCDAPCSGSGAWRRQPQSKWTLDPERLAALAELQDRVLESGCRFVRGGGILAYATCSILSDENARRIERFRERMPGWELLEQRQWTPMDGGDGFFLALLRKS